MERILKLGTRKSLLAQAQSGWVAREIEKKNPGVKVELVGIETQGDKILDKPLSQIEGKEFFTAELDRALLKHEVDFTVHSFKDLSTDRPDALVLAATPKRELPHDIIIFHNRVLEKLKAGEPIVIGTSSPRRLALIPDYLKKALPKFAPHFSEPKIEFAQIRGNVNTRISKIHGSVSQVGEPANTEPLDAVVLALAGLERLFQDAKAAPPILELLKNTRFMLLPLFECPSAPAQGALAIEAHRDCPETLKILQSIHDPLTLANVNEERAVLKAWGGGCHQKLGATVYYTPQEQAADLIIKGVKPNETSVYEIRSKKEIPVAGGHYYFVDPAKIFEFKIRDLNSNEIQTLHKSTHIFIAHLRAFESLSLEIQELIKTKTIWVPGSRTWRKLSQLGVWVTGCTDGFGLDHLGDLNCKKIFSSEVAYDQQSWVVLTHKESAEQSNSPGSSSNNSEKLLPHIGSYLHAPKSIPADLFDAEALYWPSGLTFEAVLKSLENSNDSAKKSQFLSRQHACGPGKTYKTLEKHGIPATIVNANKAMRT